MSRVIIGAMTCVAAWSEVRAADSLLLFQMQQSVHLNEDSQDSHSQSVGWNVMEWFLKEAASLVEKSPSTDTELILSDDPDLNADPDVSEIISDGMLEFIHLHSDDSNTTTAAGTTTPWFLGDLNETTTVPLNGTTLNGTTMVPLNGTTMVPLNGTTMVPLNGTTMVPLNGTTMAPLTTLVPITVASARHAKRAHYGDETTTAPPGTTIVGTTIVIINGTTDMPNGTTDIPNGTTTAPGITIVIINGTTTTAPGTTGIPNGTITIPNTTTSAPVETLSQQLIKCDNWCANDMFVKIEENISKVKRISSWGMKCTWNHCKGCSACDDPTLQLVWYHKQKSPVHSCEEWCSNDAFQTRHENRTITKLFSWKTKCGWNYCGTCPKCKDNEAELEEEEMRNML